MTLPSRISFSVFCLLLVAAASAPGQGALRGRVLLSDAGNSARSAKSDYSGVVVWLEPKSPTTVPPLNAAKHAVMLQKDKHFTPHVLAVESGTSVDFPNDDPIFHNAFSNFDGKIFDIGLYPPGTSRSVRFDRPGIVRVFCNIHSTMSAVIVVVTSPYFAITQADGSFAINEVANGTYAVRFFYESALPETLAALTRTVTVSGDAVQLEPVSISEAGYLPVSHKNKYGRDYPHAGSSAYDGGVK